MVADAVDKGELSASAERSVRPPSVRPTAGSLDVAASHNVWSSLPRPSSGGPFTPTPWDKIQKTGLSPCPNFPGRKIVYVVYCINCVLKLKDSGELDR